MNVFFVLLSTLVTFDVVQGAVNWNVVKEAEELLTKHEKIICVQKCVKSGSSCPSCLKLCLGTISDQVEGIICGDTEYEAFEAFTSGVQNCSSGEDVSTTISKACSGETENVTSGQNGPRPERALRPPENAPMPPDYALKPPPESAQKPAPESTQKPAPEGTPKGPSSLLPCIDIRKLACPFRIIKQKCPNFHSIYVNLLEQAHKIMTPGDEANCIGKKLEKLKSPQVKSNGNACIASKVIVALLVGFHAFILGFI